MPDVKFRERLWNDFAALAKKRHRKPEALAQEVIQEYLQRSSDEELLEESAVAAQRAPFHIDESDEVVREYRRSNQK